MPASAPGPSSAAKVMCFLDFWNHELTMKKLDPEFRTNWFHLPSVLRHAVELQIARPVTYEKLFIAGSYDPEASRDVKLLNWARTVLSRIPGVTVDFAQRQRKSAALAAPASATTR